MTTKTVNYTPDQTEKMIVEKKKKMSGEKHWTSLLIFTIGEGLI